MIELFDTNIYELNRTSSKGNQMKWRRDEYWYKADYCGYEGLSEIVVSKLLQYSNIDSSLIVDYDVEEIKYKNQTFLGCKSKNFLLEGEELITLERLYKNVYGRSFYEDVYRIEEIKERAKFIVEETVKLTNIKDFDKYLSILLTVDALFLNEDRHLHNIAVIVNKNNEFRVCPIFDNGAGLLSDCKLDYPMDSNLLDMMKEVNAKTICTNFDEQLEVIVSVYGKQVRFTFNRNKIQDILDSIHEYDVDTKERVKNILFEQIRKYQYLFD